MSHSHVNSDPGAGINNTSGPCTSIHIETVEPQTTIQIESIESTKTLKIEDELFEDVKPSTSIQMPQTPISSTSLQAEHKFFYNSTPSTPMHSKMFRVGEELFEDTEPSTSMPDKDVEKAGGSNTDLHHFADVVRLVMFTKKWLLNAQSYHEKQEAIKKEQAHEANVQAVFHLAPTSNASNASTNTNHVTDNNKHQAQEQPVNNGSLKNNTVQTPTANNSTLPNSNHHSTVALNNTPTSSTVTASAPKPQKEPLNERLKKCLKRIKNAPLETIDPTKSVYYYWTFVIYVGFLYNAIMCVMFVFDDMQGQFFTIWFCGNVFFDFINLLDIVVNSKLNHMEDGMMVRGWKRLAKRYMRSVKFTLDVASVLPTDFSLIFNRNTSLSRANRLLKIHRVMDFVERTNIRTNYPNGFRIFHIVVTCAVIFHLNAALYFKISLMRGINTTDFMAWEFNYVKIADPVFADCDILLVDSLDERCGMNESQLDITNRMSYLSKLTNYWSDKSTKMQFSNFTKQYSLSIYWSSLTLTTSGQQPYPTEDMHNYLEIVDTIVGVLVFAVIVGSVGSVVVNMNRDRAQIQQLMDGIKFYMNYRNVTVDIQKRVVEFIGYIEKYGMVTDETQIMDSIPRRLQGELALHLHMETLKSVELLRDCDPSILYELVLRLNMHLYGPNDYLCRFGDVAKEMYIVKTGILESISEHGLKLSVLKDGSTFGELSLLRMANSSRSNRRVRSLRSVGYSDVYQLKQEDVLDVLRDYPEARKQLIRKVRGMTRTRNHAEPESDDEDPHEQIDGVHSVEENLDLLTASIKRIDEDLNSLYSDFQITNVSNKQRMTRLETVFKQSKQQFTFHPRRDSQFIG